MCCVLGCNAPSRPDSAAVSDSTRWKFHFSPDDFLMTVKYYGPNPETYYSFSAGSPSHAQILKSRAAESRHVAFIATQEEILNWRSCVCGSMKEGRFEPEGDYTGYVVQVETNGKHMFSNLKWDLKTFNTLVGIEACCWQSHPECLRPMLDALAERREDWIHRRYNILLSGEWHRMVIATGLGSCWGWSATPKLEAVRENESVRFHGPGLTEDFEYVVSGEPGKVRQFQKELYSYAVYFALHGSCPSNSWKVYSIKIQKDLKDELRLVFYGYGDPSDEKVASFENWINCWISGANAEPASKE